MELVNELIDLKCLKNKLFLILYGCQNLVDFIVGFLWNILLFSILWLSVISLRLFDQPYVSISGSWKISFKLRFNFKMSQQFLII